MRDRKLRRLPPSADAVDVEELSVTQALAKLKIKSVKVLIGWCVALVASCVAAGIAVARFIDGRDAAAAKTQLMRMQIEQSILNTQNAELRRDIDALNAVIKTPPVDRTVIQTPTADRNMPAVRLASFSLNQDVSCYERWDDFDPLVDKRITAWRLSTQGEAIVDAFRNHHDYKTPRWVPEFIHGAIANGVDPVRVRDIARIFSGTNMAAQSAEVSRASPIFDATILNRSPTVAVLTHVQLEILDIEYAEEGGEEEPPPQLPHPLQVLGRYLLPVDEMYERQYAGDNWPRIELLPPIQIPREQAARLQVQLHFGYIYTRYLRFRLRFIMNGHDEVSSPFVSVYLRRD